MKETKKTQRQNCNCKRSLKDLCVIFFSHFTKKKKTESLSIAWTQKYSQERTQLTHFKSKCSPTNIFIKGKYLRVEYSMLPLTTIVKPAAAAAALLSPWTTLSIRKLFSDFLVGRTGKCPQSPKNAPFLEANPSTGRNATALCTLK